MDKNEYSFSKYRDHFHRFLDAPAVYTRADKPDKQKYKARWEKEKKLILRNGYESSFIIPRMIIDYAIAHRWFAYCGMQTAYSLVAYEYELSMIDPIEKNLDSMWLYGLHKDRRPFMTVNISEDHVSELSALVKTVFPAESLSIQEEDDETIIEVTGEDGRKTVVVMICDALSAEVEQLWAEVNIPYSRLRSLLRDNSREKTEIDSEKLGQLLEQFIEPDSADEEARKEQEGNFKLIANSDFIDEDRLTHHIAMSENRLFSVLTNFETEELGFIQLFYNFPYCRDELYKVLTDHYEIGSDEAYRLTENIRKGKGTTLSVNQAMGKLGIDGSYQELLRRITWLKSKGQCFQKARILLLLSRKNEDQGDGDDFRFLSSF